MQKKRRNGRASTETSGEDEIAHLRGLDSRGLRARWQSVFQRPAPAHLTRQSLADNMLPLSSVKEFYNQVATLYQISAIVTL